MTLKHNYILPLPILLFQEKYYKRHCVGYGHIQYGTAI